MLSTQTRAKVEEHLEHIGTGNGGNGEQRPANEALTELAKGNLRPAVAVLRREIRRLSLAGSADKTEDLSSIVKELSGAT